MKFFVFASVLVIPLGTPLTEDYTGVISDWDACLPVPLCALSAALQLIKSKSVAFAFSPSETWLGNCVAESLYETEQSLGRPFYFWEVTEDVDFLEGFQNRSSYDGVTVVPLALPTDRLIDLVVLCDKFYTVVQWLWLGDDEDELAVVTKGLASKRAGCRFYSLLKTPCGFRSLFVGIPLFPGGWTAMTCPRRSWALSLVIPEVPVSLCRTDRTLLAQWVWTEERSTLTRTLLKTPKQLVFNKTILIGTITVPPSFEYLSYKLQELKISDFTLLQMAPFMVLGKKNGELYPEDGIDEGLIKAFANYLTFRYSLRAPTKGLWGREQSPGNWSGLVGLIQRAEVDYGFTALSSTLEKKEVIDFSIPNFFDAVTFLTTHPLRHPPTYALIQPFSFQVWVGIFLSLIVISVIMWILNYLSPVPDSITWNLTDCAWYLYGALTQHGSGVENLPSSRAVQTVIGFWWILCLIFFTGYSGNLISFLNIPLTSEPVDNTATLLRMARKHLYKLGTIEDSQVLEILNETADAAEDVSGIFEVLRQRLGSNMHSGDVLVSDHKTGILRALQEGNFALISAFSLLEADAALVGFQNVLMAKDRFYAFQYALGFPKGSLFTEMISHPLRRLIEGGIMSKGWRDMVDRRKIIHAAQHGSNTTSESETPSGQRQEMRILSLSDLQGVFLVIFIGQSLGLAVLLGEMVLAFWMGRNGSTGRKNFQTKSAATQVLPRAVVKHRRTKDAIVQARTGDRAIRETGVLRAEGKRRTNRRPTPAGRISVHREAATRWKERAGLD